MFDPSVHGRQHWRCGRTNTAPATCAAGRGLGRGASDVARGAGKPLAEKDVIKLVAGGTGFAGREGQKLEAGKSYTLGPGSGRADLRGQAAGARSRFGLTFHN